MTAFRVILLIVLGISVIGIYGGNSEESKTAGRTFSISGALFLLSFAVERLWC